MRVLITGSSGFIGKHFARFVEHHGAHEIWALRRATSGSTDVHRQDDDQSVTVDVDSADALCRALDVVRPDAVVHLAAIAHTHGHAAQDYYRVNTDLPVSLYEASSRAGVAQFVFLSSSAVHDRLAPLRPDGPLRPSSPYSQAKARAEELLAERRTNTATTLAVVRPPVVYGTGVKANVKALIRHHARGRPVPVPFHDTGLAVVNVDDVCDALLQAACTPTDCVIIPRDVEPWTHTTFHRHLAAAAGRRPKLVRVPFGRALNLTPLGRLVVGQPTHLDAPALGVDWQPTHDQYVVLTETVHYELDLA